MKKQTLFLSLILVAVFSLMFSINAHAKPDHYTVYKYYYALAKRALKGNEKDLSILKKKAILGNSFAESSLGYYYYSKNNNYKALYWTKKAAEQGNYAAENNLGAFYFRGLCGLNKNHQKAIHLYEKSAAQGYNYAQYALGFAYLKGKGVPVKYSRALYWFKKASRNGYKLADVNLAVMYIKGYGVPKNYKKAFYYGKKSGIYNMCYKTATLYIMMKYFIVESAAKPKAAYECRRRINKIKY